MVVAVVVLGAAPAHAREVFEASFKGRGVNATFTDCPTTPEETTCNAVLVNASRFVDIVNDDRTVGTQMFVQVIEVQQHADGTFEYEFVDSGATNVVDLTVGSELEEATVFARPLMDSGGRLRIRAHLTAVGPFGRESNTYSFHDECTRVEQTFRGAFRRAEGTAKVGGVDMRVVVAPQAPPTRITRSSGSTLEIIRDC
jgi:hypothetical protein